MCLKHYTNSVFFFLFSVHTYVYKYDADSHISFLSVVVGSGQIFTSAGSLDGKKGQLDLGRQGQIQQEIHIGWHSLASVKNIYVGYTRTLNQFCWEVLTPYEGNCWFILLLLLQWLSLVLRDLGKQHDFGNFAAPKVLCCLRWLPFAQGWSCSYVIWNMSLWKNHLVIQTLFIPKTIILFACSKFLLLSSSTLLSLSEDPLSLLESWLAAVLSKAYFCEKEKQFRQLQAF